MKTYRVTLNINNESKVIDIQAENLDALTALPALICVEEGVLKYYSFNNLVSIEEYTEPPG